MTVRKSLLAGIVLAILAVPVVAQPSPPPPGPPPSWDMYCRQTAAAETGYWRFRYRLGAQRRYARAYYACMANASPPPGYGYRPPGAPPAGYNGPPPSGYNELPPPGFNAQPGYNSSQPPPGYNGAPQYPQGYNAAPPPQGYDTAPPPPPPQPQ